MKKITSIFLTILPAFSLFAQPSTTEIFLVNITDKKSQPEFSQPVNITNHVGYDNQPAFSADSKKLLYVSMPDTLQSEIYEYSINDSTTTRLTNSDESEYSPRYLSKGKGISVVRVNKNKSQRLCLFQDSFDEAVELLPGLDSIGYYLWINDSVLALVNLNNGLELIIYDYYSGQYTIPEKNIGRCLLKFPGENAFLFTRKTGTIVKLFRYNLENENADEYATGIDDVEDYAFTPGGNLLAGKDGKLFMMDKSNSGKWKMVADFSKSCGSFYRMVVSQDGRRMALVTYTGKRP